MNITQIEEKIQQLMNDSSALKFSKEDFIYQLLLAYGHRKQSVSRLRSGERNLAKNTNEVIWKRQLYFRHELGDELYSTIDEMKREKCVSRDKLRFVIVTNFKQLLAIDTKTNDSLAIDFIELPKHFDFFLPWAGMEKALYRGENPADVKAAEKMAKLFDLIKADNALDLEQDEQAGHRLNIFLTRLLFCFFAEDTGIFKKDQFSYAIESHTKIDGSDLNTYLDRLFLVLDQKKSQRKALPEYLAQFPYVNGGLFAKQVPAPCFSEKARRMLIECGSELDWSAINPDIFGSMIQAVAHSDKRGNLGMHYTSVTNIMKVIEPLFLNELYEELDHIAELDESKQPSRLRKLHQRIQNIKIFDPACGSGNFLIIAYKELRRLEMEIFKQLDELKKQGSGQLDISLIGQGTSYSQLKLSQFYGIEIDDFAHEVAILSLWLTEHQMNLEFKTEFGFCSPALPLKDAGYIVCGNATRLNWEKVCPKEEGKEVFILGNPPYLGASMQSADQKRDMTYVFSGVKNYKNLDFIACWFYLGAKYIQGSSSKLAFVSTNSIAQGQQAPILWGEIFFLGLEIGFAYDSFKWVNNARNKAGVICVVVGIRNKSDKPKYMFSDSMKKEVLLINRYLIDSSDIEVRKSTKPITTRPIISRGNIPNDGQKLMLDFNEKNHLIKKYPILGKNIKKFIGPQEFIKGKSRWILWIEDRDLPRLSNIPEVKEKLKAVQLIRSKSTKKTTRNILSKKPHLYELSTYCKMNSIFIPRTSSENREYIPMGFLSKNDIVGDAQAIYDPPTYIFAIISSRMHMTWVRTVAGRLKTDYRYSSALCYNTFPFPNITETQKETLEEHVFNVLAAREEHPDKTMAQLYDPDKMPDNLREAHAAMDLAVEQCYRKQPFTSDEKRLEYLFKLYEEMTEAEKNNV